MQNLQFVLLSSLLPLLVSGQENSGYDVPAGGAGSTETGNEAGASGDDTGSFTLSSGALIAIIIVVVVVVILGGKFPYTLSYTPSANLAQADHLLSGISLKSDNGRCGLASSVLRAALLVAATHDQSDRLGVVQSGLRLRRARIATSTLRREISTQSQTSHVPPRPSPARLKSIRRLLNLGSRS